MGQVEEVFVFWRVPGHGLVELRFGGAGGLASPCSSGTRPVEKNMRIRVDRKPALPR